MNTTPPGGRRRRALRPALALAGVCVVTACSTTAPGAGTTSAPAPAGTSPAARVAPTPTAPPGPPGTLFDSFAYTGPTDPALAAHGWTVRTDDGGPGIRDTWSTNGLSFPATDGAQGGRAMQLRLTTDGTKAGTQQVEVGRTDGEFLNGTVAARVFFTDKPNAGGHDGDHINECFFVISPSHTSPKYSELDFEYMPNGGWGATGSRVDTTSWRSASDGDRDTRSTKRSLAGWHTLMMTADNGKVTYSVDGTALFTSDGKSYPREPLSISFSTWLIDLPAAVTGTRTWDMKVNWVYHQADKNLSLGDVKKTVDAFYAEGTTHVDTIATR